jgi:hypothetical protein
MTDSDKGKKKVSMQGSTNEHELLKNADINDNHGMVKYGVDLDESIEK